MWTTHVRRRLGSNSHVRLMRAAYRIVYTTSNSIDKCSKEEEDKLTRDVAADYSIVRPCVRSVWQLAPRELDRLAQYYDVVQLGQESEPSPQALSVMNHFVSATLFGSNMSNSVGQHEEKAEGDTSEVRTNIQCAEDSTCATQQPCSSSEAVMMDVVVSQPANTPYLGWFDGDVCVKELQSCCAALDELAEHNEYVLRHIGTRAMADVLRKYTSHSAHTTSHSTASHVNLSEMRFVVERVVRGLRTGLAHTDSSRKHTFIQLLLGLLTSQMSLPRMTAVAELLAGHNDKPTMNVVHGRRTVEAVMRTVLRFAQSRNNIYDVNVLRDWLYKQPAELLPRPLRASFAGLLKQSEQQQAQGDTSVNEEDISALCPVHPFAAMVMRWWWQGCSAESCPTTTTSNTINVKEKDAVPSLQDLVDAAIRLMAEMRCNEQHMLRCLDHSPVDTALERTSVPLGQAAVFERDILHEYIFNRCMPTALSSSNNVTPSHQPTETSVNATREQLSETAMWLPGVGLDACGYWTGLLKACDQLCAALAVTEDSGRSSASSAKAQRVAHALRHRVRVFVLRRIHCTPRQMLSIMMQRRVAPFLATLCASVRPHRQLFALFFGPKASSPESSLTARRRLRHDVLALVTLEPSLTPCELYCGTRTSVERWVAPCSVPHSCHDELGNAIVPPCTFSLAQLTQLRRCVRKAHPLSDSAGDDTVCVYLLCEGSACLYIASSITDIPLRALLV